MTTTKKLTIAVVALAVALVCVVSGTLAFLVAQSNVVTNTFTYGEITINLAETGEGTSTTGGMNFTNVIPGDVLDKEPVVTVEKGSEACYVYVLIDNQLGDAATYNIGPEWIKVGESDTKVLYRYNTIINVTDADEDEALTVFTTLTFADSLVWVEDDDKPTGNVVISAYAHQSDNTDEATADAAAITWASVETVSAN